MRCQDEAPAPHRRTRQNRLRDQPFVHTFTEELAVLANEFIAEHAGRHQGPSLSRIHLTNHLREMWAQLKALPLVFMLIAPSAGPGV
jgi:exoribonuclease R